MRTIKKKKEKWKALNIVINVYFLPFSLTFLNHFCFSYTEADLIYIPPHP